MSAFIDVSAQEAFKPLGIAHLVVTERDVNPNLISNLLHIGKGFGRAWQPTEGTKKLVDHVNAIRVSSYEDLTRNPRGWSGDDVIGAIAHEMIYVDLKAVRLGGYAPVQVYPAACWAALDRAPTALPALPAPGSDKQLDLSSYPDAAIKTAFERFSVISPAIEGKIARSALGRTQRRWLRSYRKAASERGAGFIALIPKYSERGNYNSRIDPSVKALLGEFVQRAANPEVLSTDRPTYGKFRSKCKELGLVHIPSGTAFYQAVRKEKAKPESIRARLGDKEAYQQEAAEPLSASALMAFPLRAFQLGTIDHTPVPVALKETYYGTAIPDRAWLSRLCDAGTTKTLAVHISTRRPSTETIFALLWDCLKRHGRVPEGLKLDGEKAHDSIRTDQLLAQLTIDKIGRRYMKPRDGNEIEGGFSIIMRGLYSHLKGNHVFRQDPKDWPTGWTPSDFAEHTLGSLWEATSLYFKNYDALIRLPRLGGLTPDEAMAQSERLHGVRGFRIHTDLDVVRRVALPLASRGGLRKLERQTGVRIHGQSYLPSPANPIDPIHYGHEHLVRYDPTDIRYVLVKIGERWTTLHHRHVEKFAGLSPDRLAGISVEIIEHYRRYEARAPERAEIQAKILEEIESLSADPLADFLKAQTLQQPPAEPPAEGLWMTIQPGEIEVPKTFSDGAP